MKNNITEIKQQMEACKLLFKFIMGYVNRTDNKAIQMEIDNTLSGAGRALYDECMEAAKTKESTFTFRDWNLLA